MGAEFRNNEWRAARVWITLTLLGIGACFVPDAAGMDMMSGGYAVIWVSAFLAVVCAVSAIIYLRRAVLLDRLVAGKDLLAHWTYTEDEWLRFVDADFHAEAREKRGFSSSWRPSAS